MAAWSGCLSTVQTLISTSKTVTAKQVSFHPTYYTMFIPLASSALQYAVETRRPSLVSVLLSSGARIQPQCLHSSVKMSGYITGQEIAFLLIQHGADINSLDDEDQSPLSRAVWVNNQELCEELLRVGADPGSVDDSVLETASPVIQQLIHDSRHKVADLQLLTQRVIRTSLLQSNCDISFSKKLSSLKLPQKLINSIR